MIKNETTAFKSTIKNMLQPDSLKGVVDSLIFEIKQAIPMSKNLSYINFIFYFDKSENLYKKLNISDQYIDYENMSFFIDLHESGFPFFDKELCQLIQKNENEAKINIQNRLFKLIEANISKIFINDTANENEYHTETLRCKNDIYFPFANLEDLFMSGLIDLKQIPFLAKTYLDKFDYVKYESLMNYLLHKFLSGKTQDFNIVLKEMLSESKSACFIAFKIFKSHNITNQNLYDMLKSEKQYDNDVVFEYILEYSNIEKVTDKINAEQLVLYNNNNMDYLKYISLFDHDVSFANYFRYVNNALFKLEKNNFDYLLNSNSHINVLLGDDSSEKINSYSMERMLLLYRKGMLNFSISEQQNSTAKSHIKKIKKELNENCDKLMRIDQIDDVFDLFSFFDIFNKFKTQETALLMKEFVIAINHDIN